VRCALNQWDALTRFLQDGDLEIDNGASERANRGVAVGRGYVQQRIMCSAQTASPLTSRTDRISSRAPARGCCTQAKNALHYGFNSIGVGTGRSSAATAVAGQPRCC